MLQVTDQQLTNLHYLRDVVFPHVREMDRQGRADMNLFKSGCGTYRCLLGWALEDSFYRQQGACLDEQGWPKLISQPCYDPADVAVHLFGTGSYIRLFGGAGFSGDLDARAARLDEIIAEREAALA